MTTIRGSEERHRIPVVVCKPLLSVVILSFGRFDPEPLPDAFPKSSGFAIEPRTPVSAQGLKPRTPSIRHMHRVPLGCWPSDPR